MSANYHPGEIEAQQRAGERAVAERVGNGIRPTIPPAAREQKSVGAESSAQDGYTLRSR